MKRLVFSVLLCMIFILNLSADNDKTSMYLGVDLGYLDPLINNTLYNQIDLKLSFSTELEFSLPINYVKPIKDNFDSSSLGCALLLDFHPIENGLFFSFSLFDFSYVLGSDAPFKRMNYLNQMGIGYSFYYKKLIIEPSIVFINPNGVYDITINKFKSSLGGYPTIRFQLILGYRLFQI